MRPSSCRIRGDCETEGERLSDPVTERDDGEGGALLNKVVFVRSWFACSICRCKETRVSESSASYMAGQHMTQSIECGQLSVFFFVSELEIQNTRRSGNKKTIKI